MFKDAFIKLDPTQSARMVERLNPHFDVIFDPASSTVMSHALPFYDGYFLVEISRHDQHPPVTRAAICDDKGSVNVLNWSNEPIYALNVDDIDWREEPAPAGRKALGKMIEPMHVIKRSEDGTVVFGVSIVFRDSLFSGEAHVKPDGMIVLQNEELLVEDIPVADDLFGQ